MPSTDANTRAVSGTLNCEGAGRWNRPKDFGPLIGDLLRMRIFAPLPLTSVGGLALGVVGAFGLISPEPPAILAPLMSFANLVLPWLRLGIAAWVVVGFWRSRGTEDARVASPGFRRQPSQSGTVPPPRLEAESQPRSGPSSAATALTRCSGWGVRQAVIDQRGASPIVRSARECFRMRSGKLGASDPAGRT